MFDRRKSSKCPSERLDSISIYYHVCSINMCLVFIYNNIRYIINSFYINQTLKKIYHYSTGMIKADRMKEIFLFHFYHSLLTS